MRILLFFMKIAGICFGLAILLLILFFTFKVTNITIENGERYTDEEIIDMLMTEKTDKISFVFYLKQRLKERKQIPFVEKVDVSMTDRHSIHLEVYDKLVIGCVELMGGYMYFDKDGVVVESSREVISGVPIIIGLKFNKIVLYDTLEVQKESLFETILNLTKLIDKFDLPVNQIIFQSNYEVNLDIDGNRVLLGKHDTYDEQLSQLKPILESVYESFGSERLFEITMRTYSTKNQIYSVKPIE